MGSRFQSFRDFYPFYLKEHSKTLTRVLHLIGLILALIWVLGAFQIEKPVWAWGALVIGYGFAWVAHFFVERNRPATFRHPLYSLMGDFRMAFDILRHRNLHFERRR